MGADGDRLAAALAFARGAHAGQWRKGSEIPYIAHPLAVCSLVLEDGAGEDEAVAALLHDVAEDAGGAEALAAIEGRFGAAVAAIVKGCSDTLEHPKPEWRPRKRAYIEHLRGAPPPVLLVSLADKVHNARAIVADARRHGHALWSRFTTGRAADQLWYHRRLADVFLERQPGERADELDRLVGEMAVLATGAPAEGPLRVHLDDDLEDRVPEPGWLQVTTAWETIALLGTGRVHELSLDHDLADDEANGRGIDVCDWLAEQQEVLGRAWWPADGIVLHTANAEGRDAMSRAIHRYAGERLRVAERVTGTGKRRLAFEPGRPS